MCEECAQIEGFAVAKKPSDEEAIKFALAQGVKEEYKESDLVDNFHWYIQMARRRAKLSQGQLAQEIQEAEEIIRKIENGKIPETEDDRRTIKKIEQFFRLKLKKQSDFMGDDIELLDDQVE